MEIKFPMKQPIFQYYGYVDFQFKFEIEMLSLYKALVWDKIIIDIVGKQKKNKNIEKNLNLVFKFIHPNQTYFTVNMYTSNVYKFDTDFWAPLYFNHRFLKSKISGNGPIEISANYYMTLKVYE